MSDVTTCPCCGAPTAKLSPRAFRYARLPGMTGKIVEELSAKYPQPVRVERLVDLLWGIDFTGGPDKPVRTIDVLVCKANKALRHHGWYISSEKIGMRQFKRVEA